MSIEVTPVSLNELIGNAHDAQVRRVLLTSYGSVEPVRDGSAFVLAA